MSQSLIGGYLVVFIFFVIIGIIIFRKWLKIVEEKERIKLENAIEHCRLQTVGKAKELIEECYPNSNQSNFENDLQKVEYKGYRLMFKLQNSYRSEMSRLYSRSRVNRTKRLKNMMLLNNFKREMDELYHQFEIILILSPSFKYDNIHSQKWYRQLEQTRKHQLLKLILEFPPLNRENNECE